MSAKIIRIRALDGTPVEFVDEIRGAGGMKDVYFSPNKDYVVAFFRNKQDYTARERLESICGRYRDNLFNMNGGDYWKDKFCWPMKVVEYDGKLGITAPFYSKTFFFEYGSTNNDMLKIKGREKEGKWFASASNQNRFLDPREKGDLRRYLRICIQLSRAVRRLHAAGLAHSDLSYKNVLVDPVTGSATIIDVDGLVVPGKYPPDVVGTPDFIAPEVVETQNLQKTDPKKKLPSRYTDQHALAVLVYMYLFFRHPLRGGKIHAQDPATDEELGMGVKALFVEHPSDKSNRPNLNDVKPSSLPWADVNKLPYSIAGPHLKPLFERAFITGLHNQHERPSANDWEIALVRTTDLLQPCSNNSCSQKWFVFDNSQSPKCPYCGTAFAGSLPVINFYSSRVAGSYKPDNYRLMVYKDQYLYAWHAYNNIFPNEHLTPEQQKPLGYFVQKGSTWSFVNQKMPDLADVGKKQAYPPGTQVELYDGQQLLLASGEGGRVAVIQIVVK